jgi:two-component system, NarL family, response regulator DesR
VPFRTVFFRVAVGEDRFPRYVVKLAPRASYAAKWMPEREFEGLRALEAGARGFLAKDAPVEQLAGAIRTVHAGGRYIDPELAVTAMTSGESPLTEREADVLRAAADGASVAQIARVLHLTEGTVRNYLSSAMSKTGGDNRIAAIRNAQEMGWL